MNGEVDSGSHNRYHVGMGEVGEGGEERRGEGMLSDEGWGWGWGLEDVEGI